MWMELFNMWQLSGNFLWWLILCVTWVKRYQVVVKHYFWKCLWGHFCKRLAFESIDWVTEIPHQCEWSSFCMLRAWTEQKRQRKGEFALCLSWDFHLHLSLDISAPSSPAYGLGLGFIPLALLIFRPSGWDRNHTTSFFSLQSTHSRLWVLLSLHNCKSQPS